MKKPVANKDSFYFLISSALYGAEGKSKAMKTNMKDPGNGGCCGGLGDWGCC
jgi:hypothetical protein